jgi:hypothetical protein
MADYFSPQDSPYPTDSPNVRDITRDDNLSTSRAPVSLSYEDLEYDDITPAEKYPPTDMAYEQRRHRHVNPNQNAALYAAGVGYNVAEDAGRAVGGLLGKALREARKMIGNDPVRGDDVEAPRLSEKSYKTAQGEWHKSTVPRPTPISSSNDLIEGRDSDGEDEDDYVEAVDKDYIDIDTTTQPGITRLREHPTEPIALTAPLSMPLALMGVPATPSLPKNPRHNEKADRYSMSEDSDSSFETAEGGVDWPLSNKQKARHMMKVAERRVERIQAKRETEIVDLEDPKLLARRRREDERERKAKAFIRRYRTKEATAKKEARDGDKDMVEVLIKKSDGGANQVRLHTETQKPDQQAKASLPHRQKPSRTIEDAHVSMRIRAAIREEEESREQLEEGDQIRHHKLMYEHRMDQKHRRAQEPMSAQYVDRGYAPTIIVPPHSSYPIGTPMGLGRRSHPPRLEVEHEDEVPLMGVEHDRFRARERQREREREVTREQERIPVRENERAPVWGHQRDNMRQRSEAQMEDLTEDIGALNLAPSSRNGDKDEDVRKAEEQRDLA